MMIEYIDKTLFKFLREFAPANNIKVVVTGDHSTPCSLKSHSDDPVPLLVYGRGKDKSRRFNEKESRKGSIGKIYGKDLLNKIKAKDI